MAAGFVETLMGEIRDENDYQRPSLEIDTQITYVVPRGVSPVNIPGSTPLYCNSRLLRNQPSSQVSPIMCPEVQETTDEGLSLGELFDKLNLSQFEAITRLSQSIGSRSTCSASVHRISSISSRRASFSSSDSPVVLMQY